MLSFEELQRLGKLKQEFAKAVGVISHEFSDKELKEIFQEIEKTPLKDRSLGHWHEAIKARTGIGAFRLVEAQYKRRVCNVS